MPKPLISVVIPTYNRKDFLDRALGSALNQTFDGYEIIVCDNASTDGTKKVVKKYQERNPAKQIRYIRHKSNIGPVKNWFSGIHSACGRYIKILFSDDFLYPTCLETLLAPLDGTSHAFSYGRIDNLWKGSKVTSYARWRPGCKVSIEEYLAAFFSPCLTYESYPISPGAALFRTDVLQKIDLSLYDPVVLQSGIGPDMLMYLFSFSQGNRMGIYVKKKVAAFEGHDSSITVKSGASKLDLHNFTTVLTFYHYLPPGSKLARLFEDFFDQLATKPAFFRRAESRLKLLHDSSFYQPSPARRRFPFLGASFYFWRKVIHFLEYRTFRMTGKLRRE